MERLINYTKAILWVILEVITFILILAIIGGLLAYISNKIFGGEQFDSTEALLENPYKTLLIEYLPLLIGSLTSLFITHKLIFRRDFSTTGFVNNQVITDFIKGYGLAFIMLVFGFLILLVSNLIVIDGWNWNFGLFIGFILMFFIQSSFEEVVTRSFLIPSISFRLNPLIALIISSSIFALFHLANPNISWLSMANIFAAGLLMGLLFLKTKRIWAPIGLHAGWNFLQGSFFGFEVSGFNVYSLIDSHEIGNDILTGGSFGYEGSILSLITLLGICVYIFYKNPNILNQKDHYLQMSEEKIAEPSV